VAAVDGSGPLTRSGIEAFHQTAAVLSSSAAQWRGQAQRLQEAADVYVEQVNTPNGTEWSGQTAVSYFEAAHADRMAVLPAVTHAHAMADVAERGGEQLLGAQQAALAAIAQAEADDFSVGDDLSVADNYAWASPDDRAARQAAAVGHRSYIAHHAGLLDSANQRIAAQLNSSAAQMAGMAPAHWRQPVTEYAQPAPVNTGASTPADITTANRKPTIDAVDNRTRAPLSPLPRTNGAQMLGFGPGRAPLAPAPTSPDDPSHMTREQAEAAYDKLKGDIRDHNLRLHRIDAASAPGYNTEANGLNARKAELEAKLGKRETVPAQLSRLVPDWAHPAPEQPPPRPPKLDLSTRHAEDLGTDPGIGGRFRPGEAETGLRVEAQRGVHLARSPHPGADWIDPATGKTYDAVGNFDGRYLNMDKFMNDIRDHMEKADYVPVDVSQFSAEQRSTSGGSSTVSAIRACL
jgi:hypothetical protein